MRLVATSDTHTVVNTNLIPDGDVFVHAGDLCSSGYPDDFAKQVAWLSVLPHKQKILIAGNHDLHLQIYPGPALQDLRQAGVTVLGFPGNDRFHTTTLPNGMIIGGCPFVDGLQERWAFGIRTYMNLLKCSEQEAYIYIKNIMLKLYRTCDIVVTHAPPYGLLDFSNRDNEHTGSQLFLNVIKQASPKKTKHHIFGHIHEEYGFKEFNGVAFHNVAMCNRKNEHVNSPLVLDL